MISMLTSRQQEIVDYLRQEAAASGMPTVREIARRFGYASTNAVATHLRLLQQKGVIRREKGRSRNIRLVKESARPALLEIPLLGAIPAGFPSDQDQQEERTLALNGEVLGLSGQADRFALEVRGDSMIEAGIFDRDVVILERTAPRDRDIVAALIDGETTLKRYLIRAGRPFLRAENAAYPDLIPARELVVQGVFRALIRTRSP